MNETHRKVLEETKRFWAVLPQLLETIPGRWVLFKDGVVLADYATLAEAYQVGLERFGEQGGQVVAPVRPLVAIPISAGSLYGAPK